MFSTKPSRRWQPAFYPFKKEKSGKRFLGKIELLVKGLLFGCRMCGNCLLQETAFICPMECPKGLRNGPCGGMTPLKNCYVDETRKCIWYCIYIQSKRLGKEKCLLEVLPPHNREKVGTETWSEVMAHIRKVGIVKFIRALVSKDGIKKIETRESIFKTIRQPDWWRGDSEYHAPGYQEPISEFERRLRVGEFVVTAEVTPPLNADTGKLVEDIELIKPYVAAINFTDSSSAKPRMSSIACCKKTHNLNIEPVLQIAARDTTRTGLQSHAVGANELGIFNILCISGDSAKIGPSPVSNMNILDIDSIQMLWILRRMRDEGIYLDGRKMKNPPRLFLGASSSTIELDPGLQTIRDQKKINAGAQFFQTNLVFDTDKLDQWLEQLDKCNILEKVYILIGVSPIRNYKIAEYLNTKVPGVVLPDNILRRLKRTGNDSQEEGIQIALELIDSIKVKKGVNGIHIMPLGWEASIPRIVTESGLYVSNE